MTEGFGLEVDGRMKAVFPSQEEAQKSAENFDIYLRHYFCHSAAKQGALIATIGVEPQQEWIKTE